MTCARATSCALLFFLAASVAPGSEVHVIASGTLERTFAELIPAFERATQNEVFVAFGASVATAPDSVQKRLERGDRADVVIVAKNSLDRLTTGRRILAESTVDIALSRIGAVVREGARKPDISSVAALRRTLLDAKSIAYSSSLSGEYLTGELFPRLGIAHVIRLRLRRVEDARVGAAVARGDAEIGFQQISELLPVAGIQYLGALPPAVQKTTTISAGLAVNAQNSDAAKAFIRFLTSPQAVAVMAKHGLDAVTSTTVLPPNQ